MCSDSNSKRLYRRTAEWALETLYFLLDLDNVTNSSSLFIRAAAAIYLYASSPRTCAELTVR